MVIAVVLVLTLCNVFFSSFRKLIPDQVRFTIFIVVIASFVTIVDLVMKAYVPTIYAFLGIWIPLIVVNCIILGRAEAFAYHNGVLLSIADGLGMGLGYGGVIAGLALVREVVGTGRLVMFERTIFALPGWYEPPSVVMLFPGAFILFGFVIALTRVLNNRLQSRRAVAR
jgi:electron transport complex protein RnfE